MNLNEFKSIHPSNRFLQRSVNTQVEDAANSSSSPLASPNHTKCCTDCQTTTTPLWRVGPAGPKSLCNACGIKYTKKRRAQISGLNNKTITKTSKNGKRSEDLLKVRLIAIDQKQKQKQRKRSSSYERGKPWWNKLREEEQAAILKVKRLSCNIPLQGSKF
ncbi:hypothetical protein M8C21_006755, partial [Ambrosia artemisiifolia]